jgi:ABC-2 type transport system permease protein
MNLNRVLAVITRHLYNFKHNLERLSENFYWPALDIILWGLTSRYFQVTDQKISNLVLVVLSGLILWQVIWRSQYEISVNLLEELWSHNLVNLFASPLTVNEWLAAVLLLGIANMLLGLGFAILLTWFLYTINVLVLGWWILPFLISLLMTGWWTGLIVSGLIIRFGHQIQSLAWTGVALLVPFSAVYYPVSSLPLWAQKISRVIPSSYVFESMRGFLTNQQILLPQLGISFLLNFIYLFLSIVFFKYCFRKSQQLGFSRLE